MIPLNFKQVEIDFGAVAVSEKVFTITDPLSVAGVRGQAWQSFDAATGKQADENEMDSIRLIAGQCAAGSFQLYANVVQGFFVQGVYKINYLLI